MSGGEKHGSNSSSGFFYRGLWAEREATVLMFNIAFRYSYSYALLRDREARNPFEKMWQISAYNNFHFYQFSFFFFASFCCFRDKSKLLIHLVSHNLQSAQLCISSQANASRQDIESLNMMAFRQYVTTCKWTWPSFGNMITFDTHAVAEPEGNVLQM